VEESRNKWVWLKPFALITISSSWLAFLPALSNYLLGNEFKYSIWDALIVFCFFMVFIGFFAAIEIKKDIPFKVPLNSKGSSILVTLGLILTYLVFFVMGMVYILYIWGA